LTKHDKLAGLLGILPPPLLSLLKETHPRNVQVTNELQFQTFWGAYSIWKKRQILKRIHWNQRVPEIPKKEQRADFKGPPKKRRRRTKAEQLDACKNPFHYLDLSKPNNKPEYTCACNYRIPTVYIPPLDLIFPKVDRTTEHKNIPALTKHKRKLNLPGPIENVNVEQKYSTSTSSTAKNAKRIKKSGQITTEHQDREKRFKTTSPNAF